MFSCCLTNILLFGGAIILAVISLIVKYLRSLKHNLQGEAVFITGCDTGFGYHLARRLANQKFKVFAGCLSQISDGAKQLAKDFPNDIVVLELDVTSQASIKHAVDIINTQMGERGLWALVNNAGIFSLGDLELMPIETFEKIFRVNVFGPVMCSQACLPQLRVTQGRIINLCSIASTMTAPAMGAYSASKAALLFVNDTFVMELKKFNILSISIRPYFFKTNIVNSEHIKQQVETMWSQSSQLIRDAYGEEMKNSLIRMVKLGEKMGYDDLSMVIDAIETALTAKYPQRDYMVPYLFPTFLYMLYSMPKCLSPLIKLFRRRSPKIGKPTFQAKPTVRKSKYLF